MAVVVIVIIAVLVVVVVVVVVVPARVEVVSLPEPPGVVEDVEDAIAELA